MKFSMVEIEWQDHAGQSGWLDLVTAQGRKPVKVRSVGFLIAEEEDRLVVAHSYDEEQNMVADSTVIIRADVSKVTRLRR